MKRYSKKFLAKELVNAACSFDDNAEKAEKSKLKIPKKMWVKYSRAVNISKFQISLERNDATITQKLNTAFMAGFAMAWAEKKRNIK